jgi:hypothetical protein
MIASVAMVQYNMLYKDLLFDKNDWLEPLPHVFLYSDQVRASRSRSFAACSHERFTTPTLSFGIRVYEHELGFATQATVTNQKWVN